MYLRNFQRYILKNIIIFTSFSICKVFPKQNIKFSKSLIKGRQKIVIKFNIIKRIRKNYLSNMWIFTVTLTYCIISSITMYISILLQ